MPAPLSQRQIWPAILILTSVFSNDLMDQTYIESATCIWDKMASPSLLSQISCRGASDPISRPQLWESFAPVTKRGQSKPHAKPFEELISRLGQPSQLAAPKYEDSTKRYAPGRHILVVERREKNFVTLTLTVRESCSVGIYVYVNMCVLPRRAHHHLRDISSTRHQPTPKVCM
jgi:hypothetical protein